MTAYEVVGHREVLQAPAAREAVAHKIHAPDLVDRSCKLQRHTFVDRALALLATAHGQVGLPVEAVPPFVVDPGELRAQQIVNASIAKAATHVRNLHDLLVQLHSGLIGLRRMAVAVAGEPHKTVLPPHRGLVMTGVHQEMA